MTHHSHWVRPAWLALGIIAWLGSGGAGSQPAAAADSAPGAPTAAPATVAGLTLSDLQGALIRVPYAEPAPDTFALDLLRQDYCQLESRRSAVMTPLTLGNRTFERGLGTHATSRIRLYAPEPLKLFSVWIGVDVNPQSAGGSVVFVIQHKGRELYRSRVLRPTMAPERIELALGGARQLDLVVEDGGDSPGCDHADWAEAAVVTESGKTLFLDEMARTHIAPSARYPFSFTYGGRSSDELLPAWKCEATSRSLDQDRIQTTMRWTDPETLLRTTWEVVQFKDFPAADWLLRFENTGTRDSAILENIQSMDLIYTRPMPGQVPYRLQKLRGGIPHPTLFEPTTVNLLDGVSESIGSKTERTSSTNAPFFRLETGQGVYVFALEWSGTWTGEFATADGSLRARAGMQKSHFLLHPGEQVRQPRVLVLNDAKVDDAHARFRQLIYKHYGSRRAGQGAPKPTLFCNTCFTRGGGWLNECNEQNQISLIKAYAPLGLEALFTDAGWFTGGWPEGAGNWDPRKDSYPNGMGPIAAAAKEHGMIYGLWFEPERVIKGTTMHREHPEWLLMPTEAGNTTCLANFGLKEVQDYFFEIVKGFMELPGFRVYRQDFNMNPVPYWELGDTPDRQGMTEIRYVEGLYAYWERIRATWPDCFMEECASGGHRVELGTVMRFDIHQLADYWFDNEANQASLWSIGQYLPNNTLATHINRMDDYSFHSALAGSLCLGWIADDPKFDAARGKALTDRYRQVRHLLTGAWYPLTPYPHDYSGQQTSAAEMWDWQYEQFAAQTNMGGMRYPAFHEHVNSSWVASQYHRPDLDEGMILAFRRKDSPYGTLDVRLQGLEPDAEYEVKSDRGGETIVKKGSDLMARLTLALPEPAQSELITYRKAARSAAAR